MPSLACEVFATVEDVLGAACACDLTEAEHGDLIVEYADDVSDIMYILSGGRVAGRCQRTVWPVTDASCWPVGYYGNHPSVFNIGDTYGTIPLSGPDTEIMEITIDGVALNPSEYLLLNGNELLRKVGSWPTVNDITLADSEVGTFTITYRFGPHINATGRRAAIELICQMITNDSAALSRMRGVVSANIQGVSVSLDDDDIRGLGLPELSRFMDSYGGSGRGVLGVFSPELLHGWRLLTITGGSGS